MYSLIIDTSSKNMILLLLKDNILIEKSILYFERDHSSHIIENIKELLDRKNLQPKNLDKIIVGRGPGSYTGIRVSATVAKTLAFVNNIKLYSVSSLELLTYSISNNDKLVMLDCRNNNFYIRIYKDNILVEDDFILNKENINDYVLKYDIKNQILLTDKDYYLDNLDLSKLILKEEDVFKFEPNYLRKTQAEENLCK